MLIFRQGFNLSTDEIDRSVAISSNESLQHGSITYAAITSSTNGISHATSLLTTGLLAKKALDYGLRIPSFTQVYFSPGSGIVTNYLPESGVLKCLAALGYSFFFVFQIKSSSKTSLCLSFQSPYYRLWLSNMY